MINGNNKFLPGISDEELEAIRNTNNEKLSNLNLEKKIIDTQVNSVDLKNLLLANRNLILCIFNDYLKNDHYTTFDSYLIDINKAGAL